MPRPLRRYLPHQVFEITSRTLRGRYAFVPTREVEAEWKGILAEACGRWRKVKLHFAVTLSNHVHLLLSSKCANQMANWTSFVFASTAWMSKAYHPCEGPVWERRYRAIPILDDAALRARVKYLMAQACAADLVISPRMWPGLNSIDAVCRGEKMMGSYVTSRERNRLRHRRETLPENRELKLAPLPSLPADEEKRRTWFRKIEQEIIEETRERHRATGKRCPSPERHRRRKMDYVPPPQSKTSAPMCHASCDEAREAFTNEWEAFVRAWGEALEEMKAGREVSFPDGSWWPYDCHVCAQRLLE